MFWLANASFLMKSSIELATRSFLIAKRLREETVNGISSTEFENLKRELVDFSKSLESALEANLTLNNQIKELSDVHAYCETEKESLKDEIAGMTAERLTF